MANLTTNYSFTKPLQSEQYNIDVQNANWDTADAQLNSRLTGTGLFQPGKRIHRAAMVSANTDASGFLTVTHGAPFTPTAALAIMRNPASYYACFWGSDLYTDKQLRMRFFDIRGGLYVTNGTGPYDLICFE